MADEPKLTKYCLIICFALAVVVLGLRELHFRVMARQSATQHKADSNLVAHLYGVSDVERSRYSQEVIRGLVAERDLAAGESKQSRWDSWAAFFDF